MEACKLNFLQNFNGTVPDTEQKKKFEGEVKQFFIKIQDKFTDKMKNYYTNWNAGHRKNGQGKKTFDFKFDRKSTVARADVEKMIDGALSTGNFQAIDELYVKILNGTCRHVGHSGPHGFPSKKDKCAIKEKYVDKQATKKKLEEWISRNRKGSKPRPVQKEGVACKRRKPQPILIGQLYIPILLKGK